MSTTTRTDKTLCYDAGIGEPRGNRFFFSPAGFGCGNEEPVIELEQDRIRIGCWYITLNAFAELDRKWLKFRRGQSKLRIQG